jgi:maleate isomerase
MGYGRRRRIGLLVPSSNTTMESEFCRMSLGDVSVHAARMRLEDVTREKLVQMAEDAERAATLLETAGVDVIVYGCTTGSLVGGVEWEERLVRKIEEDTGIQTLSTGRAVVDAIEALGGGTLAVATPYTDDLNGLERAFLESFGIRVSSMKGLGLVNNLEIGRTDQTTVEELVRTVADSEDIVFISCTNLPTISLIKKLEEELQRPIVTSNQASLWAALRGSGITGIEGYGELLRNRYLG